MLPTKGGKVWREERKQERDKDEYLRRPRCQNRFGKAAWSQVSGESLTFEFPD